MSDTQNYKTVTFATVAAFDAAAVALHVYRSAIRDAIHKAETGEDRAYWTDRLRVVDDATGAFKRAL